MNSEAEFRRRMIGRACQRLLCQEYWYKGKLHEKASVLFVELSDRKWLRFFFDCGEFFWREEASPSLPETGCVTDEYYYPMVDLTEQFGVGGRNIEIINFNERISGRSMDIGFAGGRTVLLEYKDDRGEVSCSPSSSK